MRILVTRNVWEVLGLDDKDAMDIARAYFYLGQGLHATERAIKLGREDPEVAMTLSIAVDCGLRFDDLIIDIG